MKILRKNLKAFTLIEIIVVLIILGVLAAIALPNLFKWIKISRTSEIKVTMTTLKNEMLACIRSNVGNENQCYEKRGGDCTENSGLVCNVNFGLIGDYTYRIKSYFCTSIMSCDTTNKQGWTMFADHSSGSQYWLSGNPQDTLINCFTVGEYFKDSCV